MSPLLLQSKADGVLFTPIEEYKFSTIISRSIRFNYKLVSFVIVEIACSIKMMRNILLHHKTQKVDPPPKSGEKVKFSSSNFGKFCVFVTNNRSISI